MPYRLLVRAAGRASGHLGWARGAVGAGLGLLIAGLVSYRLLGLQGESAVWLAAPVGASAVLLFVLPASPLAQPWPVIGGNLLSALVGLATGWLVPAPPLAAALGIGGAITLMGVARCVHPPGGACALIGALAAGHWQGLLPPLLLNLAILLVFAWFYNGLTGHPWPHRAPPAAPLPPGTYETADLEAVLEDWEEVLDVSPRDLDALFRAVERRVLKRQAAKASASTRKWRFRRKR